MMKHLAILTLILPVIAQADVILVSDNRSVHVEGLEADTGFNTPFNQTKTPAAPFADFLDSAVGGSAFGSAFTTQISSLSPTEFTFNGTSFGIFNLTGGGPARQVQYQLVNTFDVEFLVTSPQAFTLDATGHAFGFDGHTTTATVLGNLTKDAVPYLLAVDRSITPLDPISLSGILDPGLYHIQIENIMAGNGAGSDILNSDGAAHITLRFVPDTGSTTLLLGLGLLGLVIARRVR